jgi:hypothetical protein
VQQPAHSNIATVPREKPTTEKYKNGERDLSQERLGKLTKEQRTTQETATERKENLREKRPIRETMNSDGKKRGFFRALWGKIGVGFGCRVWY